jgi:hypothetical protein
MSAYDPKRILASKPPINVGQNEVMKIGGLSCGNTSRFDCRNLRDELQEYARTELGMGLSFCFVFDCFDDPPAANLVQVEGLDLTIGATPERKGSHCFFSLRCHKCPTGASFPVISVLVVENRPSRYRR